MIKRQKIGKIDHKTIIKRSVIAFLSWGLFFGFVDMIPPSTEAAYIIFYILIFIVLFFTFGIFLDRRRSVLYSTVFIMFLILLQIRFMNVVTVPIVLGILVTGELYFRKF